MALLNIFEFLFYTLFKRYKKSGEKDIPGLYALGIITFLQMLNVLTLLTVALLFRIVDKDDLGKVYFVLLNSVLLLFNYVYIYKKRGKENVLERFKKKKDLRTIKASALTYVLLTIIFFITPFLYYIYS